MTIRDTDNYLSQLWDWGFFDECFLPTRIKVTDIDGFVERNKKFLVIETKSHNAPVPMGQQIMFDNMIKTGLFTVLVIWGEANYPEKCLLITRKIKKEYNPVTAFELVELVKKWFRYANST